MEIHDRLVAAAHDEEVAEYSRMLMESKGLSKVASPIHATNHDFLKKLWILFMMYLDHVNVLL